MTSVPKIGDSVDIEYTPGDWDSGVVVSYANEEGQCEADEEPLAVIVKRTDGRFMPIPIRDLEKQRIN